MRMHLGRALARGLAILLAASTAAAVAPGRFPRGGTDTDGRSKIDAQVLAAGGAALDVLIVLSDQADLFAARARPAKRERGERAYRDLVDAAHRSQGPLVAWLEARGIPHETFWIANMVRVRASRSRIEEIARRPDVARIEANLPMLRRRPRPIVQPAAAEGASPPRAATAIPWNLVMIGAPDLWAAGFEGQGVVVGNADTGVAWTHPALQPRYRGWNGATASHAYNWHDAVHDAGAGNACGSDSAEPCDDDGHGTLTAGVAVGDDGAGNRVGVAPGARWIGCRNMDQGVGTPARYAECFQWFLAPTDADGANPRPDLAPDVITNSWDCPPGEGCTSPDILRTVVENVRAAGILVVVSAGNEGPGCDTVGVPAIYDAVLAVGASDPFDDVADFSSRGPGEGTHAKPDVVAPGVDVLSSNKAGGYGSFDGTSASSPHAAGLAALILSASPGLAGDTNALEAILRETAVPKTGGETCGGIPPGAVPNDTAGYGRIDAGAALLAAQCPASAPGIDAPLSVPALTGGHAASVAGLPGHAYSWTVTGGSIASGQGRSAISFESGPPGTLLGLSVIDSVGGCASPAGSAKVQVDFSDVPPSQLFYTPIVKVARAGITAGCGGGNFCPDDAVTRAQMAVFILRAVKPAGYKPPPATGTRFADVPPGALLADWIEQFAAEGFTNGCGDGNYCPDASLNRSAAAVFLLRAKHTPSYSPPAAQGGVFGDVPLGTFLGAWIEELAAEGITSGCGSGDYCPDEALSRGEMAAFLARTFSLP